MAYYRESQMPTRSIHEKEPYGGIPHNGTRTRLPSLRTPPRASRRFWEDDAMANKGKAIVRHRPSRRDEPVTSTEHMNALSGNAHDKQELRASNTATAGTYGQSPDRNLSRPPADIESDNSEDVNLQSSPISDHEEYDYVYKSKDVGDARHVIVKQEFELLEDLDDELEELGRLTRTGNFRAAKAFFTHHLKRHIENPLVFVLYAELLLEIGDYQSIIQLENIAQTAIPRHLGTEGPPPKDDDRTANSSSTKLYLNWKLVHLIAWGHNKQDISRIRVDLEEPWLSVLHSEAFDSTQVRILFLLARLWKPMRFSFPGLEEHPLTWRDWRATYSILVDEQRAWDFRDMFLALINLSELELIESTNFFFDSETPTDFLERIKEDWLTGSPEVSVYLAFLDLSSSMVMTLISYKGAAEWAREALEFADELGEKVMELWPEQTGTRPYLMWLVAKAATAVFQEGVSSDGTYEGVPCSASEPGLVILPISNTMIPALPFYIPIKAENPGWSVPAMPPFAERALRVVYGIAKWLENYALQAACICELAIRSEKPITLMDELAEVQRAQGDLYGRLETCLAKYLVCQSEESKQTLRHELASFGYWEDVTYLSTFQAILVAARDVQLRALSPADMVAFKSSISAALPYYDNLPLGLQQDLDDNSYAKDRGEQHMRKNPRGQLHKDAGIVETTQEDMDRGRSEPLDQDTFGGPRIESQIPALKRNPELFDKKRVEWADLRQMAKEQDERHRESSRSSARHGTSIPRPQDHEQGHDEIRIVDVPYEYTSAGMPIPVEHPEQSVIRRPDTFATVQSASSSPISPSYDGPKVTEWLEGLNNDSAKEKHSGQEGLSSREAPDSKITDQVGHESVLERGFPSVTSRPKRATSVDLGEFSRRSKGGPVS